MQQSKQYQLFHKKLQQVLNKKYSDIYGKGQICVTVPCDKAWEERQFSEKTKKGNQKEENPVGCADNTCTSEGSEQKYAYA